jgi:hypothetical protein
LTQREQRDAQKLVDDRISIINEILKVICRGGVEGKPKGALRWEIAPRWGNEIPIRCDGLSLVFLEELSALPSDSGFRLVCVRFKYKVEAMREVKISQNRTIPLGWQVRYELSDSGPAHSFENACSPTAIVNASKRRSPLFHAHIEENGSILDDSFHYPIGDQAQPLHLAYEILRLIKDEFI